MSGIWNGHAAAVSLTFDDGTPGHLNNAAPEMTARGMNGTFFVVTEPQNTPRKYDTEFRAADWRTVALRGHEIGGHSRTHRMIHEMESQPEKEIIGEVAGCKRVIESAIEGEVDSYAYPYNFLNFPIKMAARCYKQARGGEASRADKFITPGDGLDFHDIPCYRVFMETFSAIPAVIEEAIRRNAWVVFMLHGIGEPGAFDNVDIAHFNLLLDELQEQDVWVATFAQAAEKLRTLQ